MRIQNLLLPLAFLPLVTFGYTDYEVNDPETLLASDRYYDNVPLLCYAGFRAVVDLLPELTNQLNIKMGAEMVIIDNVVTPNGFNTVFEWDVVKSLTPKGVGHYTLAQTYTPGADTSTGSLYVNFTTKVPGQIENIWMILDKIMIGCADNLPEIPVPGIPG